MLRYPKVAVPTGIACFAGEPFRPPRAWIEKAYNVAEWRDFPKGGHFAAFEQPGLFVPEVRDFFRLLRRPSA
jgi:pimeloyl-ACP methyl ester carboxylesterase